MNVHLVRLARVLCFARRAELQKAYNACPATLPAPLWGPDKGRDE